MDRGPAAGAGHPDSALSRELKGPRNCKVLRKTCRSARQRPSGVRLCLLPRFSRTHPPSSARRILWVSTSSTRGLAFVAGARLRVGLPGSARVNVLSVGSIRWIYPLDLSVDLRRPAECLSHSLSPSLVEVAWTEVPSPARHQPPARSRPAAPRAHLPRVSPRPLAPPAAPGSPPAEPAP